MYKIALFYSLKNQIWLYLLFSKHSYTTDGFGGHNGFWKKTVILLVFCQQLDIRCLFTVYIQEVKSNHIKLLASIFASLPVLATILKFSILTFFFIGSCSPNVLMTNLFLFRRSKPIRKAILHEQIV